MNASATMVGGSASLHTDFHFLRREIRKCLRPASSSRETALAENQDNPMVSKRKNKLPKSVHICRARISARATETQRPGFSRECLSPRDYTDSRYVRAISRLGPRQIQILHAKYHSSSSAREMATQQLSLYFSAAHTDHNVRLRARLIILLILRNGADAGGIRSALEIDQQTWRSSYTRKIYQGAASRITALDQTALLAWDNECVAINQGVQL